MGAVTDLAGVIVWTSADRHPGLAAFYRDLLGLPVRTEREGFINFDWQGRRLIVAVHSEVAGPARDALRIMVNLVVEGLDELYGRLQAAGVDFIRPPEIEHWGGRMATLADPDGNIVQLLEMAADTAE
jgi:predicted enzyme related to lactoylglutathione lyase